jgi:hypothetical protein
MSDNVNRSSTSNVNMKRPQTGELSSLMEALKSGNADQMMMAVQNLLNSRGAKIPSQNGKAASADTLRTAAENTKLSADEKSAITQALQKATATTKGATTTSTDAETQRASVDPNESSSARRHAATAERARQAALEARLPVEDMGRFEGVWDPKVAQKAITELDKRQASLETEKKNLGAAITEVTGEIKTLEGKPKRTDAEDLLLMGKRQQLDTFKALDEVLDGRIDQMKRSKGALKYDNFENEIGKNEVSREEALALAQQGVGVDTAANSIAQLGRRADANVIRAQDLVEKDAKTAGTTQTEAAKPLDAATLDKTVSDIAMGVGTDKSKINSASKIFAALDGKTPAQIDQIKKAYNEKYAVAGSDKNGKWEGGWDFDKNVRGNMHQWNKQAFDALATGKPEAKDLIAEGAKKDQQVNAGTLQANFDEPGALPKADVDKAVSDIASGVGGDKTKINSASKIFAALDGKTPQQIDQIKTAYNEKYGKDGWDFDKNVRGNMHTWNKEAFDALASGKPEAKSLIAEGAKKDQQVNAGTLKADFSEPKAVTKPEDVKPGEKPVEKLTHTVSKDEWLSRIAANYKNKDGSTVTVDQLKAQPENKAIFDRQKNGDLIYPGEKVTMPEGAVRATPETATTTTTTGTGNTSSSSNKVKTGLKKENVVDGGKLAEVTVEGKAPEGSKAGELRKKDFVDISKTHDIDVAKASKDPALKGVDIKKADLDGDGKISTDKEYEAVYAAISGGKDPIDVKDVNGTATKQLTALQNAMTEKKVENKTDGKIPTTPLNQAQVDAAVENIRQGVGTNRGQMESAGKVLDTLKDMTPDQIKQVKDAYDKKFAAQGFSFENQVKGVMFPWNQAALTALEKGDKAAFATLREEAKKKDVQAREASDALFKAVDGGGTDEDAIFKTLKQHQNDPAMLHAIQQTYKAHHKEDLRTRLKEELESGDTFDYGRNPEDDAIRADAMLSGNAALGSAALMHSYLEDGSSEAMERALTAMTKEISPERRKGVAAAFEKQYGKSLEEMVRGVSMNDANKKAELLLAARDMKR